MNFGNIDVKRTLSFLKKKPVLLLASLVLLVTFVIGGTVAWIVDTTEPVVNTFLPTKVEITVDEDFDQVEKKNVRITNTGDVDAYVRATIVMNWVDGGNVLVKAPEGAPTVAMPTPINGWSIADDGFWY